MNQYKNTKIRIILMIQVNCINLPQIIDRDMNYYQQVLLSLKQFLRIFN